MPSARREHAPDTRAADIKQLETFERTKCGISFSELTTVGVPVEAGAAVPRP